MSCPIVEDMANGDPLNWEEWVELASQAGYRAGRLSQRLGISQRHLERITGRLFGLSPQNWLDEQRMTRAVELLLAGQPIKLIASDLGFKWVSHFCMKFKRHHRRAPGAFRALAKVAFPATARSGRTCVHKRK